MATAVTTGAAAGGAPPGEAPGRATALADALDRARAASASLGFQQVPKGSAAGALASAEGRGAAQVNPYLGLVPDPASVDLWTWQERAAEAGRAREEARRGPGDPLLVDEDEPDDARGGNDTPATAQDVPRFGTGRGDVPAARLLGTLAPFPQARAVRTREDDGAIPLATDLGLDEPLEVVSAAGTIGDGPHGSAGTGTGDFDFYRVDGSAGQLLRVDIDADASAALDSVVLLYDARGQLLAGADDAFPSLGAHLSVRLPADGPFYAAVSGFSFEVPPLPEDPFDPASGFGVGSEGPYAMRASLDAADVDAYAVDLRPGDVLGASGRGPASDVAVVDPSGQLVIGSNQDLSFIYPAESPLPGGGAAVLAHVADTAGRHVVLVTGGEGDYDVTVEAYRPGGETTGVVQTVYLDFDGARVNTGIWGGPGVRTLSPMRAFLGRWGLRRSDEAAVTREVVRVVEENLRRDTRAAVPRARVRVLDSRRHADPGLRAQDVSRIVVGGTIAESGIPTIGIAQSIDPGNFGTEDVGLVLLDLLSEPRSPEADYSLNTYLRPRSARIRFVAQAIANVVSHEVGHTVGSFHVDQFDDVLNLMDQGGNFPLLYGVGQDGVGGTADDPDVDFGEDVLVPNEGLRGVEDTLTTTAWGLARP